MSTVRASGLTQTEEVTREVMDKAMEEPAAEDPGEEREIVFRTPGFSRIRTEWRGDDALIVQRVQGAVEEKLIHGFPDAYALMNEVYDLVRTPELDGGGNPRKDRYGFIIWARTPTGSYDEDWSRLTRAQRETFMFEITTRIFGWEQQAVMLWTEAMLAKAQFEERFSIAYDLPMSGTIEDRTAAGKMDAADERYFAIYCAALSRGADSIVNSLKLLGQRLKDTMEV